ncbi:MAG TPA: MMPL family transporter [Sphingobium sp.]|uniref:hopanoid transporter HpnN n=1 Tax=Sphingobium sp. TaxID=1912891 RepID=UPI002ED1350F
MTVSAFFSTAIPRLVSLSTRRPWVTAAAGLLLGLLALLFTASHFKMTTDTGELISPDVDWRRNERAMKDAFPQLRDVMLIVVDGKTPELAEAGAAKLADRLRADRAHFQLVRRPDGGDFFAREGLLFGSREDVRRTTAMLIEAQPMLGPLASDPSLHGVTTALGTMLDGIQRGSATLDQIDRPVRALSDAISSSLDGKPTYFSWQRLFSNGDGALSAPTRRLILVRPVLDYGSLTPGKQASRAVDAAATALGLQPAAGVEVHLTGEVPLSDEEFSTLEENIGFVGLVMLGAMLVTLWLATRSVRLVVAIMGTIIVGLIVTLAIGMATVGRLNLISLAFIPLFVGLGVDFGIQICVRFNAERAEGAAAPQALRDAASALGVPLLLAAGAVFLGFGAFLPTAYVGIAELGVIAGVGMVIALGFSVTLLPALVLLLRPGAPVREVGFSSMAPLDRALERHRAGVLWAFGISMAISIALLPWVSFDFNPLHLRASDGAAMRTLTDLTRDPDRTPNTIDIVVPNEKTARTLAGRLEKLPEVKHVIWIDSFVPADQPAKLALIGDANLLLDLTLNPFDIPPPASDAELTAALRTTAASLRTTASGKPGKGAADALRLAGGFERLAAASPAVRARVDGMLSQPLTVMLDSARAMFQAESVSRATLPPELARDWLTPDGRYHLQVVPSGDASDNHVLERFRAAVLVVAPMASGFPVATQAAAFTIAGAFVQAGVIALILVSLLLFLVLRNVREVAFTLAPVVLSIFLTLGTCVIIGQPINFANIIAFPLLFGVGVAFHIYFVMAWRGGATDLLQSSLARAILFSALATGTAFGSLWLSHHPGTASMGKILMISLIWTFICALIFEPALLGPPRRIKDEAQSPAE